MSDIDIPEEYRPMSKEDMCRVIKDLLGPAMAWAAAYGHERGLPGISPEHAELLARARQATALIVPKIQQK